MKWFGLKWLLFLLEYPTENCISKLSKLLDLTFYSNIHPKCFLVFINKYIFINYKMNLNLPMFKLFEINSVFGILNSH